MRGGDRRQLCVLSHTPGQLRVHLPDWPGEAADRIESGLRAVPGVRAVQANPLTGNVLVRFDHNTVGALAILTALRHLQAGTAGAKAAEEESSSVSVFVGIGVRGLLGHAAVDALWFGAGSLGQSFGLPLAGALGPLHVLMDVVVWGMALRAVTPRRPGA